MYFPLSIRCSRSTRLFSSFCASRVVASGSLLFYSQRRSLTMSDVLAELQPSPKKTKTFEDDPKLKTSPIKKLAVHDDENREQTMTARNEVLRFAKLSDKAFPPTRGSTKAAGFDLYSAYDCVVAPKGKLLCDTDLQVAIPEGCYGRVAPRSGLAVKHFIDVGAGVVDSDYRGHLKVLLFNFGDEPFEVKRGERIAQLICERVCLPELLECTTLDETDRGDGGFGSTGR